MVKLKGKIDKYIILVEDFNLFFLVIENVYKNISKDIKDLNSIIKRLI